MANNSKRSLISNYVVIVKASQGHVAVGTWYSRENKLRLAKVLNLGGENVPLSLGVAANRINMMAAAGMTGQAAIVMQDEAVLKAFSLQKCLNKALGDIDAASALFFKNMGWMGDIYRAAVVDLLTAMVTAKEAGLRVFFAKESNLATFDLTVKEGVRLERGQKLVFDAVQDQETKFWHSTALDGAVECENHFVTGEHEVLARVSRNPNTGAERVTYRIPRIVEENEDGTAKSGRAVDQHILNLRKSWWIVRDRLPSVKVFDASTMVEEEEDAA